MNEDDFKRASLRGRGWKIMRGEDKSPQDEPESDASVEETPSKLRLTPDEIDDVLDAVPPPLGTMPPAPRETPIYDDVLQQEKAPPQIFSESHPITSESFEDVDMSDDVVEDDEASFYDEDEEFSDDLADLLPFEPIENEVGVQDIVEESYDDASDVMITKEASRESITGIFEAEEFIPEPLSEEERAELQAEISDTQSLTDMLMTEELRAEDLVYQSETLSANELSADEEETVVESGDFLEDSSLEEFVLEPAIPDPEVVDPFGTTQFDPYETTVADMVMADDNTFIPLGEEIDERYTDEDEEFIVAKVERRVTIEGIPAAEDTESVDAIDLSGVEGSLGERLESLVPDMPEVNVDVEEQPDVAFGAFSLFDEPADNDFRSEGALPSGSSRTREGMPLVEDLDKPRPVKLDEASQRTGAINELVPDKPEIRTKRQTVAQLMEDKGSGGIYMDVDVDSDVGLESPFGRQKERPRATDLFAPTRPADGTLLGQLVDETRLHELWDLIEALQDEVVEQITGDRERTDVYQQELLIASGLLLESRENYDDAKAIAYRIRADLNRDRQVSEDIRRNRPLVLNYIVGWGIALVLLALMNGLVKNIADNIEAPFFAAAYLPTVFGAAGGLFLAYSTLHKHTSVRRDFDSIHLPWYLFSPLVGGLMGFLVFLLSVAVVTTTVTQDITDSATLGSSPVVIWALAFVGGMQQNWVISWLQSLRGRISGGNSEAKEST